ncbi:MAG: TRAP transporter large permease subunit [Lachnospiraceae bacterium]
MSAPKFGIAQAASDLLGSVAHNQFVFLLIVNIIFLIAGCFIDANSAMYIFHPDYASGLQSPWL